MIPLCRCLSHYYSLALYAVYISLSQLSLYVYVCVYVCVCACVCSALIEQHPDDKKNEEPAITITPSDPFTIDITPDSQAKTQKTSTKKPLKKQWEDFDWDDIDAMISRLVAKGYKDTQLNTALVTKYAGDFDAVLAHLKHIKDNEGDGLFGADLQMGLYDLDD